MNTCLTAALMAALLTAGITAPAHARPVTVNPECSEQSMRTAPNGSCIRGSECPVIGQKLNADGNCVTHRRTNRPVK